MAAAQDAGADWLVDEIVDDIPSYLAQRKASQSAGQKKESATFMSRLVGKKSTPSSTTTTADSRELQDPADHQSPSETSRLITAPAPSTSTGADAQAVAGEEGSVKKHKPRRGKMLPRCICWFWLIVAPSIILMLIIFFVKWKEDQGGIAPPLNPATSNGPFFQPFSTAPSLFAQSQQTFVPPMPYWGDLTTPYPTNQWWGGFAAPGDFIAGCPSSAGCTTYTSLPSIANPTPDVDYGQQTTQPNYQRFVVNSFPYLIRLPSNEAISIQYAIRDRPGVECNATRLNSYCWTMAGTDTTYIWQPFSYTGNFQLSGQSPDGGPLTRTILSWDFLAVVMEWNDGTGNKMTNPLVKGSPYITMIYDGLQPSIPAFFSPTGAPASIPLIVNGQTLPANPPLTVQQSTRLTVQYSNANMGEETYVVYTSRPVDWTCTLNVGCVGDATEVTVRVAYWTAELSDLLDQYAGTYAMGATLDVQVDDATNTANIIYQWQTVGPGPFVALAMPHHVQLLTNITHSNLNMDSGMGGLLIGVESTRWVMSIDLPPIAFTYDMNNVDTAEMDVILAQLAKEDYSAYLYESSSTYTYGKLVAKFGMLACLADDLDQPSVASVVRQRLQLSLENKLNVRADWPNTNPLQYETKFGGLCSDDGLSNPGSPWFPSGPRDFGNGIYNDHHYHLGYWLFAVAAAARNNVTWLTENEDLYARVLELARDIANPSYNDSYFTTFRMKDWWEFHSWANGFAPATEDGTDQESTTESVNAYYGLALLGATLQDQHMYDVGRVLLAMEILATQTYYQMMPSASDDGIYPPVITALTTQGQIWSQVAAFRTFFCAYPVCIHAIQTIPVTNMLPVVIQQAWNAVSFPLFEQGPFGPIPPSNSFNSASYKCFMVARQGMLDQAAGFAAAQALDPIQEVDEGLTLTNLLVFIASQS